MPKFVPLTPKTHGSKGWRKAPSFSYAARSMAVPVSLEELPHVMPTLPLVFLQSKDEAGKERFELAALLSLTPGINLFVTPEGRWLGGYIPAALRAYPFRMLRESNESSKHVLCFDEDSGLLVDTPQGNDLVFYDEGTRASLAVMKMLKFLTQVEQDRSATQAAVDLLAKHKLIQPWPVNIEPPAGKPVPVDGLFRLDEGALKALKPAALQALQAGNALPLAYAQLFTQQRLKSFDKLYELRAQLTTDKLNEPNPEINVDALLKTESETLKVSL